jgi:type II secretory pathway pseudopilin PulG
LEIKYFKKGFILIELLVVIFILVLLAGLVVANFRFFQTKTNLEETALQLVSVLRLAQNKAIASEGETPFGVRLENNRYTLFLGSTYQPSSPSNQQYLLTNGLEIFDISLNGGGQDIVFNRLDGRTSQFGQFGVRLTSNPSQTKTIYIESSGRAGLSASSSSDVRQKDSRHVHFNYGRVINTNSENIVLTFSNPTTTQEIVIKDNLDANGQINWQGEVAVGGQNQKIEVKTHQLNNPGTIFSITRDRRHNNKALSISLSGEPGYNLVDYTDTGTTTIGSSIYVSNLEWQ